MDDAQVAIDAEVNGQLLNEWFEANGLGRSIAFGLVSIVQMRGLEPERQRLPGASKPSVFLTGDFLRAMDALAAEHKAGASLALLKRKYTTAIATKLATTTQAALDVAAPAEDDARPFQPDQLMRRLQATKMAIETGLPLRRAEIEWLLGGSVTSMHVRESRLIVSKHGPQSWSLAASRESAE